MIRLYPEQLNAQLQEGLLEFVGPLVPAAQEDKTLSIAMREINEGMLTMESTGS